MLTGTALSAALASVPACSFEGMCYRAVDLEALFGFHNSAPYAQRLPLFSEGARHWGARYTPIGGPASLYLALDPPTAYAEANRVHTQAWSGMASNAPALPPTVLISVRTRLESVLDVTSAAVQKSIQTTDQELLKPWRVAQARGRVVASQILGQAAFDTGRFQALQYSSALSPGANCLVVFPERLLAPAYVEAIDPHLNIVQKLP